MPKIPRILLRRGREAEAELDKLAQLRIAVFHEYPYLYEGDLAYEADYLRHFMAAEGSVLVLAEHEGRIVGASTGLPLAAADPDIRAPFADSPYAEAEVFYYGESVLLPAYRGLGIGKAFFAAREAHARSLGACRHLAFCAVERPADHPLRPADYRDLGPFWQSQGFAPSALRCYLSWRERGEAAQSAKALRFWLKTLMP